MSEVSIAEHQQTQPTPAEPAVQTLNPALTEQQQQPQAKPETDNQPRQLTRAELTSGREKLISGLQKARALPESWSAGGKTKAQLIEALEMQMSGIRDQMDLLPEEPSLNGKAELGEDIVGESEADSLPYITVGAAKIPVCRPPKDAERATWKAVAGRLHVEGGKKWSEVTFEKRGHGGLPESLKPGDEIMFGEHRGERLAVIDNILEGAQEVRAFDEVFKQLARLQAEYQQLNPDEPDYDEKASQLAAQVAKFTTPEVTEAVDVTRFKVADVEGFAERMGEIVSTQEFLQEIDPNDNEFIPKVDPSFKMTPYFEEKMAWFAQLVNRQIGLGNNQLLEQLAADNKSPEWAKLKAKGMTVVVGPRGTGKNKLADHYAALAQRPMFRYACSPDKTEYDLTYDVLLKDGEVVKIPSRIITAVTTPNALLELDEVNLLQPAVSKFFNSLLDHDRAIFLNNEIIHAEPGVVIVGLMNPADYQGVEDLPETIDDRSNAMLMGYPPFKEKDPYTGNERFTYDEALILKGNIGPLANIPDAEFTEMWEQVVNGAPGSGMVDPEVVTVIKDLKNIISIANKTREIVKTYKTTRQGTRMERDLSLRGSTDAARFYSENHLWKADLANMPDYKQGWNAAAYAIASTYLPHTLTYQKGQGKDGDAHALELILAEQLTR